MVYKIFDKDGEEVTNWGFYVERDGGIGSTMGYETNGLTFKIATGYTDILGKEVFLGTTLVNAQTYEANVVFALDLGDGIVAMDELDGFCEPDLHETDCRFWIDEGNDDFNTLMVAFNGDSEKVSKCMEGLNNGF